MCKYTQSPAHLHRIKRPWPARGHWSRRLRSIFPLHGRSAAVPCNMEAVAAGVGGSGRRPAREPIRRVNGVPAAVAPRPLELHFVHIAKAHCTVSWCAPGR